MSKFIWKPPTIRKTPKITELSKKSHEPLITTAFLYQLGARTVKEIRDFLDPSLDQLDDAYKMHDMQKGVDRINKAISIGEKITIYGDYDTDGITSTSIMYETLKTLGANVHYFIPNRFKDGYGPNLDEYKRIIAEGTTLIITVDNGIAGLKQITWAEKHGCDVIITDHHDFPPKLPPAYAIIMAAFPKHHYSYTGYCGAGIAFKIATALFHHIPYRALDLAATGTIADIVDVKGEDRILIDYGLKRIRAMVRPGFKAMLKVADIKPETVNETSMGFSIIPRLNALGRLGDAGLGVKLLTTHDPKEANKLASITEKMNRKRQKLCHNVSKEAMAQASQPENLKRRTLVIVGKHWHEGVVGIVASHLVEHFHKPTLVLNDETDTGHIKGSGRSIPGFDLSAALNPNRPHMLSFGGHPMACGLTIEEKQLPFLKQAMEQHAIKNNLQIGQPEQKVDVVVPFEALNRNLYESFKKLAPFGQGNPKPVLEIKPDHLKFIQTMGKRNDCLRMYAYGKDSQGRDIPKGIRVISFKDGQLYHPLKEHPDQVSMIGYLELNHWKGNVSLQFQAIDYKIKGFNQEINKKGKPIMPNKSEFTALYVALNKRKSWMIDSAFIKDIANHFNISQANVKFMLNVFFQLEFITVKKTSKGIKLNMNPNPKSHPLTDSTLYQKKMKSASNK